MSSFSFKTGIVNNINFLKIFFNGILGVVLEFYKLQNEVKLFFQRCKKLAHLTDKFNSGN